MRSVWLAATATVLLAACGPSSPRPAQIGGYRLKDGSCVNFANLPPNWKRATSSTAGTTPAISGKVAGVRVAVVERAEHLDEAAVDDWPNQLDAWRAFGRSRAEREDLPGFQAWHADVGHNEFAVIYVETKPKHRPDIIKCFGALHGYTGDKDRCQMLAPELAPRDVEIEFPWSEIDQANVLISNARAAFSALGQNCPP